MLILTGRIGRTVIATSLLIAGLFVVQVKPEVRWQVMISPFNGIWVNAGRFVPLLTPFTFHWYKGSGPGFPGVALKVTEVPVQTVIAEEVMLMLTGNTGMTVTATWLLEAGLLVVQGRLEFRSQLTTSPFAGIYVRNVEFVPLFIPFTFHWKTGVVPSLTGVAVKVTDVPSQTVVKAAEMLTFTLKTGRTVMVTWFALAGLFEVQLRLDVSWHVITSPSTGV